MVKLEDTNLSVSEREAIEELRIRVTDQLPSHRYDDDLLFYRFLRARNYDMDKAEIMLRKHLEFRKAIQVDTILQDFKPKEVFMKYIRGTVLGNDKEGNIVLYFAPGRIFVSDLVKCYKYYDFYKHILWMMEGILLWLKDPSLTVGKNYKKLVFIFDLADLELQNVLHPYTPKYLMYMGERYEYNFPELLKSVYVINAPTYYMIAYYILKKVLIAEIMQKFHNFGRSGWQEALLKAIDADTLPAFLGGNRTDPDGNPMCNTFVCHSGKVPPQYYLTKADREFKDKMRVQRVSILPQSKHDVIIEVKTSGSVIQWEFEVPNKEIDFGLYYRNSEENFEEVLPLYRYETYNGTVDGTYKCQAAGTYIIRFDNSYSWLNIKELSYCITVLDSVN